MNDFRYISVDVSNPSSADSVIEAMIEHAVEERTAELEKRVESLVEERDNLEFELYEANYRNDCT